MTTQPPGPAPQPGTQPPLPAPPAAERPRRPRLFNGATMDGVRGRRRIRHPWELPLLWMGVALAVIAYGLWAWMLAFPARRALMDEEQMLPDWLEDLGAADLLLQFGMLLPLIPIILWVARAMMYAQMRATAVRMSPTQFPEGYRMVAEAAQEFGMRRVPDAYVQMGSGVLNAFASGHGFRRFVVIHSDMFEVGGRTRDPEALRFVIGHEVGHLAAGHVSYFRLVFMNVLSMIPILGTAFSRAQEFTADNYGYAYAPAGAPGVMGVLSGGKYLNAEVNVNELADRAATDPSLFVHIVNWLSTHPVTTWRAHALRDRSKPGSLWIRPGGSMFTSPLPPGHTWSSNYPTPGDALAMLDAADARRPVGADGQFGRFPGADYSQRPDMRALQTSAPLLADRTAYVIPHGPYRADAKGTKHAAEKSPYGPPTPPAQMPS
ncbi:MAG: M48 family metallopeptidase [Brachybacterium sp.]